MSKTPLTTTEIRNLSDAELTRELTQARQNLTSARLSVRTGKEKATHHISNLKSLVARLLTIQNERLNSDQPNQTSENPTKKVATKS